MRKLAVVLALLLPLGALCAQETGSAVEPEEPDMVLPEVILRIEDFSVEDVTAGIPEGDELLAFRSVLRQLERYLGGQGFHGPVHDIAGRVGALPFQLLQQPLKGDRVKSVGIDRRESFFVQLLKVKHPLAPFVLHKE